MSHGNLTFDAEHRGSLTVVQIFDLYIPLIERLGLGSVAQYWLGAWAVGDRVSGSAADLRARLATHADSFQVITESNCNLTVGMNVEKTRWSVRYRGEKLDAPKLEALIKLCETLFEAQDPPLFLGLARAERDVGFVPSPPIARHRHVMMTTEAEVAEMYDAPSVFWGLWDTVHAIGDRRLCIRGRKNADLYDFIVRIFESNMVLAHHARPGLTEYRLPDARFLKKLEAEYYTWWKLGPCAEELGGMPALTFVGHDTNADVFHYSGFIEPGEHPEHGRVQIRELLEVKDRCYTDAGENAPGRVHVLFPEEWMARQERRPLRDVGARVFFYGKDGTKAEVVD